MATWIDGGAMPPRPGYYAEEAERALERGRARPHAEGAQAAATEANAYATLEVAAAVERLSSELADLDAGPLGRESG